MRHILSLCLVACFYGLTDADDLPTCQPHDFHYEYTECDSSGGRWRVSVPPPNVCIGGAPNPPVRGKGCDFTCDAGQYLDIQGDQECHPCPAGTYSLGGGVRYNDWDTLPSGFATEAETFSGPAYMAGFGRGFGKRSVKSEGTKPKSNCTGSGWVAAGKYISVQAMDDCYAALTYSANLVRAGDVRFTYQYSDSNTLLHFQVQNSECQTIHDRNNNRWPTATQEDEWKTQTLSLQSGLNILTWKVFAMDNEENQGLHKPVLIKSIEIMGIAFTSECMKCKGGTISKEGASECTECEADTYSNKGDIVCKQCDPQAEYSAPGASECVERKPCSATDYYSFNSPCDTNNMTKVTYNWIEPKICRDDLATSVKLPEATAPEACPPCNPGMELRNNSCQFCPPNHFSDGSSKCQPCPGSTAPDTGLMYKWWNNLPDNANVSAYCLSLTNRGCASKSGWQPSLDHIHSGRGHADDVYLVLTLKVGGFRGKEQLLEGRSVPVGEVTFVFSTECSDDCSLIFMQQNDKFGTTIIKTWEGSQERQAFSYKVVSTEAVSYIWAFQKKDPADFELLSDSKSTYELMNDRAVVYAINVTNTLDGGSTSCKPCPEGTNQEGCIPCPAGQYVNAESMSCTQCPVHTIARTMNGQGSCVPCGPGLETKDNVRCETSCKFVSHEGKEYDFTSLSSIQTVEGTRLFTSGGTQYYHLFNMSLCGGSEKFPTVSCDDNITYPGDEEEFFGKSVVSTICRSTIIPPVPGDEGIMSAQPVSLGDTLVKITDNGTSLNMDKRMEDEGFSTDGADLDVHFVYNSNDQTSACAEGRTTVITLRCDPAQTGSGMIQLPPRCSDGTCDGCFFHFLWHSKKACPLCKREQYQEVKGECVDGKQTITFIPPKHCILSDDSKTIGQVQECSVKWPAWLTVVVYVVPFLVILVVMFIILTIYCCLKNRKLEYKYMKLAASSGGKDGNYDQLPAADSCALEDGEEEEQFDAVHFKEKKGNTFFNKLKGIGNKKSSLMENLKSIPVTFQKSKKYGLVDPDQEELFSEEEEININTNQKL